MKKNICILLFGLILSLLFVSHNAQQEKTNADKASNQGASNNNKQQKKTNQDINKNINDNNPNINKNNQKTQTNQKPQQTAQGSQSNQNTQQKQQATQTNQKPQQKQQATQTNQKPQQAAKGPQSNQNTQQKPQTNQKPQANSNTQQKSQRTQTNQNTQQKTNNNQNQNQPNKAQNQKNSSTTQNSTLASNEKPKENEKVKVKNNTKGDSLFNLTKEMETAFINLMGSLFSSGDNNTKTNNTKKEPETEKINQEKQKKKDIEEQEYKKERQKWEQQVSDTSFNTILTISLDSKKTEIFNEDITEPTYMKFAFMINHRKTKIDFIFSGPGDGKKFKVIHNAKNKNFFFDEFNATLPGKYSFYLNNQRNNDKTKVTFALSLSKVDDKAIGSQSFDALSEKLNRIDNKMSEIKVKGNLAVKKIEGHNKSISKHNRTMIILSIIEIFTMIIIFFIQATYLVREINKL